MKESLCIKVTKIKNRWHARLYDKKTNDLIDEMACEQKIDISYICSVMLRWADKIGFVSPMASASRTRNKNVDNQGKIWYRYQLLHR